MENRIEVENWLPVNGFQGYQVSSLGQVKDETSQVIAPFYHPGKKCYMVSLQHGQYRKNVMLHKLVAESFVERGKGGYVVHLNGDKADNRAENLKYVDFTRIREFVDFRANSMLDFDDEKQIMLSLLNGETGANLAMEYNTSEMAISRVNQKMIKQLRGELRGGIPLGYITSDEQTFDSYETLNMAGYVYITLKKEQALFSIARFCEMIVEKFSLSMEEDAPGISTMLSNLMERLIKIGIIGRVSLQGKQRYYYGLSQWFDKRGNIKKEYLKRTEAADRLQLEILRQQPRVPRKKVIEPLPFIADNLQRSKRLLSVDELIDILKREHKVPASDIPFYAEALSKKLEEMFISNMLKRVRQKNGQLLKYGFTHWFKKDGGVKSTYQM